MANPRITRIAAVAATVAVGFVAGIAMSSADASPFGPVRKKSSPTTKANATTTNKRSPQSSASKRRASKTKGNERKPKAVNKMTLDKTRKVAILGTCESDVLLSEQICKGATCLDTIKSCFPFACNRHAGKCRASCSKDRDCATGTLCLDGACTVERWTCHSKTSLSNGRETVSCGAYSCKRDHCLNQCNSAGDCKSGLICDAGGKCITPQ